MSTLRVNALTHQKTVQPIQFTGLKQDNIIGLEFFIDHFSGERTLTLIDMNCGNNDCSCSINDVVKDDLHFALFNSAMTALMEA